LKKVRHCQGSSLNRVKTASKARFLINLAQERNKHSVCDLICDGISCEAAIWVKINIPAGLYEIIVIENHRERKIKEEIKETIT